MLFWFTLFLDVSGWAIRLTMVPVIALRQKNPTTCLAWLAIIFVLPWIGLLAYLLMGERSLGFLRVRERLKRCRAFDALHRLQWALPTFDDPRVRRDFEVLVQLAESHGGLPLLGGNRVDLLADVEGVVRRLVEDIDQAREHVHLVFYIFRDDTMGRTVGEALIRASANRPRP